MKKSVTFLIVIAAVVALWLLSRSDYGEKLEFNSTDVYFTEYVSKEEAQRLGEYLVETSFADGLEKSIQLSKRDSTYLFRMVVKEGVTLDSANDLTFEAMAIALSWKVFDRAPVELEACNNSFKTLRVYGKH